METSHEGRIPSTRKPQGGFAERNGREADPPLGLPFSVQTAGTAGRTIRSPAMADREIVYRLGRFELDPRRRELRRDGVPVKIAHRHVRLLEVLLSHRDRIVSSEELFAAGWDTAVEDNSVKQAVAGLRKQLRDDPDAGSIKTFVGQGYQFIGAVTKIDRKPASAAVASAMVGSYNRLREAHEALATMSLDVVSDAKELIASALRAAPESVGGQIDMAMACILVYEASRIDVEPDV